METILFFAYIYQVPVKIGLRDVSPRKWPAAKFQRFQRLQRFQKLRLAWVPVPDSGFRAPPEDGRLARQEPFDTAETAVVQRIARVSRVMDPTAETAAVRFT
ncbi:MAG: hypothetical protein Kow00109_13230 [Acidobacteriota bacterium]